MNEEKRGKTIFFTIMTGLALAVAILTKINGLILIPVMILLCPLPLKHEKLTRSLLVLVLTAVFGLLAATKIYIGLLLPLVIYAAIMVITGVRYYSNAINQQKTGSLLVMIAIGMGLGLTWLIELRSRLPEVFDSRIADQYLLTGNSVKTAFPDMIRSGNEIHVEIMHGVNFWTAGFVFFLGTMLATIWLLPKIAGILKGKKISPVIIWLFSYLMIWTAYYSNGSLRYLTPVQTPVAIIVAIGVFGIWRRIRAVEPTVIFLLFIGGLACLNYYYLISPGLLAGFQEKINSIGKAFNQAGIWYNSNPLLLVVLGVVPAITICIWVINRNINYGMRERTRKLVTVLLMIILVIFPIVVPVTVLLAVNFDMETFHEVYIYDNRQAVKEVVEAIIRENQPLKGILTINFPNLAFLIQQPVIDLYQKGELYKWLLSEENVTKIMIILKNPLYYMESEFNPEIGGLEEITTELFEIKFVVIQTKGHYWYDYYIDGFYNKILFFRMLDNRQYFELMDENSEFRIYKII